MYEGNPHHLLRYSCSIQLLLKL